MFSNTEFEIEILLTFDIFTCDVSFNIRKSEDTSSESMVQIDY